MIFGRTTLLITVTIGLLSTVAIAADQHRLAFSKKLAVEIFAEGQGDAWCRATLQLRVVAGDETLFKKKAFRILIQKLGSIIRSECSIARAANIYGYSADTGEQILRTTVSQAENWIIRLETPVTASRTDIENPAPPPAISHAPTSKSERNVLEAERQAKLEERRHQQEAASRTDIENLASPPAISPTPTSKTKGNIVAAAQEGNPDGDRRQHSVEGKRAPSGEETQRKSTELQQVAEKSNSKTQTQWILMLVAVIFAAVGATAYYVRRGTTAQRSDSTFNIAPDTEIDAVVLAKTSPALAANASAAPYIAASPAAGPEGEDVELAREENAAPEGTKIQDKYVRDVSTQSPVLQAALAAYDEGNFAAALAVFNELAEENLDVAQFALGFAYEQGKGVEQNDTKAANWYRKAAEQGMSMAQRKLGWAYENGRGVSKDQVQAVKWYRKAAEGGDAEAQLSLGLMYVDGEGVQEDDIEAMKWYQKAAEQGLAEAQYALGVGYGSGEGVPLNSGEAAKWFKKAAEQEYALAQLDLGRMYLSGCGVPQDSAKAASLILKAAEQNEPEAQTTLSSLYEEGIGVAQDEAEALKWLQLAAEGEEAEAQLQLGLKYFSGKWVKQDHVQAVDWFRKAAEQGHASAQTMLGFAFETGEGAPKDQEKAFEWFHKAAEQGVAEAQYNVGLRYLEGRGTLSDAEKASSWLSLAASQGHEDSVSALQQSHSAPAIRSDDRDQVDESEDADGTLIDQGWRLFMDGKDKEALAVATEVLREFPNDPKAWALSAEGKAATGLLKDAEFEYKKAVDLEPSNAIFRAGLGSVYEKIGDVEQALEQYRVAMEFEPGETDYRAALFGAMRKTDKLDEAIKGLKQCVAEKPDCKSYATMLGEAYMAAACNCLTFVPPGNDVPEGYYATTKDEVARAESYVREASALNSSDEELKKEIREMEKTFVLNRKRFFGLSWRQWIAPLIYIVAGVSSIQRDFLGFVFLAGSGVFYIFATRPPQYILNRAIIRGLDEGIGDKALNLLEKVMDSNVVKETNVGMAMGAFLGVVSLMLLPFIAVYRFYQNYLKD